VFLVLELAAVRCCTLAELVRVVFMAVLLRVAVRCAPLLEETVLACLCELLVCLMEAS
jgi:hypothetical protein